MAFTIFDLKKQVKAPATYRSDIARVDFRSQTNMEGFSHVLLSMFADLLGEQEFDTAPADTIHSLHGRLNTVEGDDATSGSIAKSLKDAKAYTDGAITSLVNGAPAVLDTLKEIADALGNDPNLSGTLATQISGLGTRLDTIEGDAQTSGSIQHALSQAEAYTDSEVSSEASVRAAADASVRADLSAEASRAEDAEASLANAVSAEASARDAADASVQSSLSSEVSRAQSAEASLAGEISAEASARDAAISDAMNQETSAAVSLADGLAAEISRATSAEESVAVSLGWEISRAQTAEVELYTSLTNHENANTDPHGQTLTQTNMQVSNQLTVGDPNTGVNALRIDPNGPDGMAVVVGDYNAFAVQGMSGLDVRLPATFQKYAAFYNNVNFVGYNSNDPSQSALVDFATNARFEAPVQIGTLGQNSPMAPGFESFLDAGTATYDSNSATLTVTGTTNGGNGWGYKVGTIDANPAKGTWSVSASISSNGTFLGFVSTPTRANLNKTSQDFDRFDYGVTVQYDPTVPQTASLSLQTPGGEYQVIQVPSWQLGDGNWFDNESGRPYPLECRFDQGNKLKLQMSPAGVVSVWVGPYQLAEFTTVADVRWLNGSNGWSIVVGGNQYGSTDDHTVSGLSVVTGTNQTGDPGILDVETAAKFAYDVSFKGPTFTVGDFSRPDTTINIGASDTHLVNLHGSVRFKGYSVDVQNFLSANRMGFDRMFGREANIREINIRDNGWIYVPGGEINVDGGGTIYTQKNFETNTGGDIKVGNDLVWRNFNGNQGNEVRLIDYLNGMNQTINDNQNNDNMRIVDLNDRVTTLEGSAGVSGSVANALSVAEAYTDQKISDLINGAPEALDTLKELADALGNDANLAATITTQLAGVSSDISAEASARTSADASLESSLSTEASARTAADASLASDISSEASARAAAVSLEASSRVAGDASLESALSAEASDRAAAVSSEASARIAADTSLATSVNAEASSRAAADASLASDVSTEASARAAAVSAEASARTAADASLASDLSSETSARTSADASLTASISSEASTRTAADASLASDLSAEVSARASEITRIEGMITDVSPAFAVTELTSDAAVDDTITVPAYTVGAGANMMVWANGMMLTQGAGYDYVEVGTVGTISTTIQVKVPMNSGWVIRTLILK